MRIKRYTLIGILLLLVCSVLLVSCDAITAQKITDTGSGSGGNGRPGFGGGQGMQGGWGGQGGFGTDGGQGGTRPNGRR
ncbi:hypothetical protein [Paenibacillus sp. NFR01]|uniref:hypothetical protein n=1 Tax=Paenibacillus sp. NFR01 TaxID=1566279 RepID=UPI0008BFFCB6|nr:hypothetical protein [Paenibacillus sp. NFR01]SET48911.1 hypothetical protein SAMN03159358_1829 [Paenibacillus sp. NFR01]